LGTPFWVLFHPDEGYQPLTTLYFVGDHQLPISGQIAPAIALNAYPPTGLIDLLHGNQQAQQGGPASSSWEQPAHLVEPPPPPPVIPLANQMQFIDVIQHGLSAVPFLSSADIARLRAVGRIYFRNGIPLRLPSAYTSEDINSITLSAEGALFLNNLIKEKLLTNIQIHYLDDWHLNLLDEINLQNVLLQQNQNQLITPVANSITLTQNQILGLDMLHLHMLCNHGGRFQALARLNFLTQLQIDYFDLSFLGSLADATDNQNYVHNGISVRQRNSFSYETRIVKQLFIMAAGTENPDFLPGIGAFSLLDAQTLSYRLPNRIYVVTELFYLYERQNTIHSSGGQFAITHGSNTGNVSWLIPGPTLNQISNDAFSDLVQYINAHNTEVHFSVINLRGLSIDRYNEITDQTLLQTFIYAQGPEFYAIWQHYLQTHHEQNSWGAAVRWLTFLSSNPNNGEFCLPVGEFDRNIEITVHFVRNRITILQEMYNNMTEEQRAMFGRYYSPGGRRTEQTTEDSDTGTWEDSVVANAHNLELPLIQDSLKEVRADTKTTAFVRLGETKNGTLENNQDHDWYLVDVKAGINYKFVLKHANNTDHLDPWLNLRDTNGKIIKSNDDSAGDLNSLIQFKATQNATYYLDACSWRETSHGQFSLTVMAA
jgi:hypothetical protein